MRPWSMVTTAQPGTRQDVAWAAAREFAHAAAEPVPPERVPLAVAAGLVLAEELRAATPLPGFDTSAMDGYAVAGTGPWRVVGVARAGRAWPGARLDPGCAVEISTGAVVPPGARAVLPVEMARLTGDLVRGPELAPGKHVRAAGEDAGAGERLAHAGTPVGPALIGLAATCGYDELVVRGRPVVRAVVTGDELARSGLPAPGAVRDALGPLLPSLIAGLGGEPAGPVHVPDQPESALWRAVEDAGGADVVVVTGSTSVGTTDGLRRLLAAHDAEWIVDAVACRPGHPQLLARLRGGPFVVGLPGNPFAALVAAHTVLGPLLAGLAGRPMARLPRMPLTVPVRPAPGRTRIIPVVWDGDGVRPLGGDRPAFLNGAALGDALAAVPENWKPGGAVPLVLLRA
ncbi:molybdopterin molybdotransferase MoeA [Nonomuraea sp. NPDC050663]|uniref:molybdopterin molybdotransferase MoeA n=1 Tax=Nonomuraea sp. NPDC050663 TaxID=3364370 RepID=UPI0037B43076